MKKFEKHDYISDWLADWWSDWLVDGVTGWQMDLLAADQMPSLPTDYLVDQQANWLTEHSHCQWGGITYITLNMDVPVQVLCVALDSLLSQIDHHFLAKTNNIYQTSSLGFTTYMLVQKIEFYLWMIRP
jgi:hypothetical protein